MIYVGIFLLCMFLGTLAFNLWWAWLAFQSPDAKDEMTRRGITHTQVWVVIVFMAIVFPIS